MPRTSAASMGATGYHVVADIKKLDEKTIRDEIMPLVKSVCFEVRKLNVAYQTACTNGNVRGVPVIRATGGFVKDLIKFKNNAKVKKLKTIAKSNGLEDLYDYIRSFSKLVKECEGYKIDKSDNCYPLSADLWEKLEQIILCFMEILEFTIEKVNLYLKEIDERKSRGY